MAITQIGSEVFRTLSNGMKVSTRTEGNKIFTKLFDKDEKLLIDRVKSFERSNVGSKIVRTKTEDRVVNVYSSKTGRITDKYGFTYQADRVYNQKGEILGMRETEYQPVHLKGNINKNWKECLSKVKHVVKSVPTKEKVFNYKNLEFLESPVAKSYIKDFEDGKVERKFATELIDVMKYVLKKLPFGCRKSQYNNSIMKQSHAYLGEVGTGEDFYKMGLFARGDSVQRYNKKGLPLPRECGFDSYVKMENMSLKEMRDIWLGDKNGWYAKTGMNMEFLD